MLKAFIGRELFPPIKQSQKAGEQGTTTLKLVYDYLQRNGHHDIAKKLGDTTRTIQSEEMGFDLEDVCKRFWGECQPLHAENTKMAEIKVHKLKTTDRLSILDYRNTDEVTFRKGNRRGHEVMVMDYQNYEHVLTGHGQYWACRYRRGLKCHGAV